MENFEKDLEALLRDCHPSKASLDRERELNVIRSGSAPPTVEGSRTAVGSLFGREIDARDEFSEEEMISNPAYLSYYNYHKNLNPRLPPPAVSNEDLISLQRLRAGAIGDRRMKESTDRVGGSSSGNTFLFCLQPGVSVNHGERLNGGIVGLNGDLSAKVNNFAVDVQEDISYPATISRPISRPVSRNAFGSSVGPVRGSDSQRIKLQNELLGVDHLQSGANSPRLARVQSLGSSISQSFASGWDSFPARSITPDPKLIRRSPSPCPSPVGSRIYGTDRKNVNLNGLGVFSSHMADSSEIAASLTALSLQKAIVGDRENVLRRQSQETFTSHPESLLKASGGLSQYIQQTFTNHPYPARNGFNNNSRALTTHDVSNPTSNGQIKLPTQSSSNNLYSNVASVGSLGCNNYQNVDVSSINFTGSNPDEYSPYQRLPSMLHNQLDPGGWAYTEQHLNRAAHQVEFGLQLPNVDPLYLQYVQGAADSVVQSGGNMDPAFLRDFYGTSLGDLSWCPKAYLEALLAKEKLHYGMPSLKRSGASNHGFYESPATGLGFHYPTGPEYNSVLSSLGRVSPLKQKERISRFPISKGRESVGSWNTEGGLSKEGFVSPLLEEFKNSKARPFELSEIVGHVVEFSSDQYGSRFIQQKLEIATADEKEEIFTEILPSARELMIDVFGNYVIQKFFEHGTERQRKQLANQLIGHVLPLSFQMYGCRVIQKALEVIGLDQQTQMVAELDGSVMKCVRDQNGNHVIQKCIECVPQEKIQFIISAFYGQVVTLSTHPYGCRVIQRVLEHCDDVKAQNIIIDEILRSVYTLAQDQYGNYVVQHVLQHGTQEERSAIISKFSGKIVNMSQQKFASNVVEKCLTYGTAEERQLLIDEMLGSTDENDPLQVMMKDQFGNYVVQKVLEICSNQNRELILSRIRVHLNTLKKYTYGKHIVSRVEKLLATGERRSGIGPHSS